MALSAKRKIQTQTKIFFITRVRLFEFSESFAFRIGLIVSECKIFKYCRLISKSNFSSNLNFVFLSCLLILILPKLLKYGRRQSPVQDLLCANIVRKKAVHKKS